MSPDIIHYPTLKAALFILFFINTGANVVTITGVHLLYYTTWYKNKYSRGGGPVQYGREEEQDRGAAAKNKPRETHPNEQILRL